VARKQFTKKGQQDKKNRRRRVMVIMAHPDDAEFTVAGTVARWARQGDEIVYLLCTSGNRGSDDEGMTPERLTEIREAEQRAACEVLGVKEVVFLRYDDGTLQPTLELRRDITREIRRYRPDAVICFDPTHRYYSNYINHPDHRAAASAALDAIFPSAQARFIFPELLAEGVKPHRVKEVYIHGADPPDVWIDISETIDLKIKALRKHKSQVSGRDVAKRLREWGREEGREQGMKYAESYRLIKLR
jgi:LmbE family N-acetylglucosaminyl deacetylase